MSDFVERFHPVDCIQPAADAGGRTGAYMNVKNVKMVWVAFHINQGNAATVACDVLQATDLSGSGAIALPVNVPIWANMDTAASDALVRATDAKTYTTDAGVKRKIVVFQIDPATLNLAGGFAYIAARTGASNAANITEAEFFSDMNYEGALPPSVVI